ncbi:MAG: hypothetical protein MJZ67_08375 [Bacteroidales bacterium]|nr:hypothetical protein [Bacteroidales bacterium]
MKKFLLVLITILMAQCALAQHFSFPIMPQKMWPSDYAKYEGDVLNCCDYLINTDPQFNKPMHEECASFLLRWLEGAPNVHLVISNDLVDAKKANLLVVYMAAWTRHSIKNPEDNILLCANVAVEEMLNYYYAYKDQIGKSKLSEKLLKQQSKGNLATYISSALAL